MAITTGDGYIASTKQVIPYVKTTALAGLQAGFRHTLQSAIGNPAAATSLVATTTPGALYTAGSNGFPAINFSTGSGYLTRVYYYGSVLGRFDVWDKIYGVSVSLTALGTTTITSPPSISGRLIGGTDYASVRIFLEFTTTVSATATTVQVTYTDQGGTSRNATATATLSGFVANRWLEIPLVPGSTGVQKIESVTVGGTVATAGAINVILVRQLWGSRVNIALGADLHGLDKTGMPQVFPTSALVTTFSPDSTSSGTPELFLEIANL